MKKINIRYWSMLAGMGSLALCRCGGDDSSSGLLGTDPTGSSSTGSTSSGGGTSSGSATSSGTSSGDGTGTGSATTSSGTSTATGSGTTAGAGGAGSGGSGSGPGGATTGAGGSGAGTAGSAGASGRDAGAGGSGSQGDGGPGNGCPILPPGHDARCTSPVPLICNYPGYLDQGVNPCDQQWCSTVQKAWHCQRQGCPTTMPNPTTSCTPPSGENLPCVYPSTSKDTVCYCLSANSWSCQ
jgi:hypothetical protein